MDLSMSKYNNLGKTKTSNYGNSYYLDSPNNSDYAIRY